MNPKDVRPFSNATEATTWIAHNCDVCSGRSHCYAKKQIEFGFICGVIKKKAAMQIGIKSSVFYDNDPSCDSYCTLNDKCDMFGKVKPKKPKPKLTDQMQISFNM